MGNIISLALASKTLFQEEEMDLMTKEEVSEYLRVPVPTLSYWRAQGEGPQSFKLGRRVMYRRQAVEAYVNELIAAEARTTTKPVA